MMEIYCKYDRYAVKKSLADEYIIKMR